MKKLTILVLAALALALPARADKLSVFRNTLGDVVSRSRSFHRAARIELKRGGPSQNTVLSASADLSHAALELQGHLDTKAVDRFDSDLEAIQRARDRVDGAIGDAGAPGKLRSDWRLLRDATDAMLQIASGNGDGQAQAEAHVESDSEAPVRTVVAPPAPPAGAPRIARVSLIGPEEMHFAAADLAAMLDAIAGQVRRYGRMDGSRRAALDALGAMRVHCDSLAGAPTLEDIRPAAQQLPGLIASVDRTLPNLGDYGTRRPLWQQARKLALGIVKRAN